MNDTSKDMGSKWKEDLSKNIEEDKKSYSDFNKKLVEQR
jgi:hypothetical protein